MWNYVYLFEIFILGRTYVVYFVIEDRVDGNIPQLEIMRKTNIGTFFQNSF